MGHNHPKAQQKVSYHYKNRIRLRRNKHRESGSLDSLPIFDEIYDGFRQIFKFPTEFPSGFFSIGILNSNGIPLEVPSEIGGFFQTTFLDLL